MIVNAAATSAPSPLASYYPLLVHHYYRAGIPEKERSYAKLAGEHAAAQFANAEAVRYFTRALELTPEAEKKQRYSLLLEREKVYALHGDREAQEFDIVVLEKLADALGDQQLQAEVALRRARYAEVTERMRARRVDDRDVIAPWERHFALTIYSMIRAAYTTR